MHNLTKAKLAIVGSFGLFLKMLYDLIGKLWFEKWKAMAQASKGCKSGGGHNYGFVIHTYNSVFVYDSTRVSGGQ